MAKSIKSQKKQNKKDLELSFLKSSNMIISTFYEVLWIPKLFYLTFVTVCYRYFLQPQVTYLPIRNFRRWLPFQHFLTCQLPVVLWCNATSIRFFLSSYKITWFPYNVNFILKNIFSQKNLSRLTRDRQDSLILIQQPLLQFHLHRLPQI